jgi:hypothetical protein
MTEAQILKLITLIASAAVRWSLPHQEVNRPTVSLGVLEFESARFERVKYLRAITDFSGFIMAVKACELRGTRERVFSALL